MEREIPGMTAAQARAWLGLLALSQRFPAVLDQQLTADADLINTEYGVLSILVASPDQARRMTDLAALLESPVPRLSKAVTRLERRELVERRGCAGDGRAINVRLTAEGRRVLAQATGPHLALATGTVLDGLGQEQLTELANLLEGILHRLSAAPPAGRDCGAPSSPRMPGGDAGDGCPRSECADDAEANSSESDACGG